MDMENKDYNLSELIGVFDNAASPEECEEIIGWFLANEDRHVDGQVYGYGNPDDMDVNRYNQLVKDYKNTRQAFPSPQDSVSDVMSNVIFKGFDLYSKLFPIPKAQPLCVKDYSIRIYHKDVGCFKEHADQAAGGTVTRVFGIILYLNDVEEGGETEFMYLGIKVKPVKGRLLIFPCNYLFPHSGNVPISDDKYIITAFINFADVKLACP